ncbi:hypothetical protein [Metallosphaera sp.]|uniref:hypothetical protein n=1 Tax=Metallosphaera sp. TaxID=2020860 RepID=UPI003181CF7A
MRWGHLTSPTWVIGSDASNPPANTALVSFNVPGDGKAYIYGLYIATPESNDFYLSWVSNGVERRYYILFGAKGTLYFADLIPLNEGLPADPGTTIAIKNVNAGTNIYRAGVFVGLVEV